MSSGSKLISLLLGELFGPVVATLGEKLYQWNKRTLQQLATDDQLGEEGESRTQRLKEALAVMIHHNFVSFGCSERTGKVEYSLIMDNVLAIIRYPRYMLLCRNLFGREAEVLIEDIYKNGQLSCSKAVVNSVRKLISHMDSSEPEQAANLCVLVLDKFKELAACQFIERVPSPYIAGQPTKPKLSRIPVMEVRPEQMFVVPDLVIKSLRDCVNKDMEPDTGDEKNILWRINYQRFHREFRDQVLIQAVSRRIDSSAGNLMRIMLNLMNETRPWEPVSNPIAQMDIVQRINRADLSSAIGSDGQLQAYHIQYIKVLEEDKIRFIHRIGDAAGGQFVINVKHIFQELCAATAENIIMEKYGSKALRIFRLVRDKVHVEEAQLQSLVMIPAKETKELTYMLLEDGFLHLQELRKSTTGNAISKTFYLFYVDMNQLTRSMHELCYKAITSSIIRRQHEASTNQRLLDKYDRIQAITSKLKNSENADENSEELQLQLQEVQEMLSVQERDSVHKIHEWLDQLIRAASQVDETLFLINMSLFYMGLS